MMYHHALILILSTSHAFRLHVPHIWSTFKELHEKKHDSTAESQKADNFYQSAVLVAKHNIEADLGKHSYHMGLNEWSDLDEYDFLNLVSSSSRSKTISDGEETGANLEDFEETTNVSNPASIDFRKLKRVTDVKRQGYCRCAYAFSGVGAIEGQWARVHGILESFSTQNIVDCSGSCGCAGGTVTRVFDHVRKYGINDDEIYPYVGRKHSTCKFDPTRVKFKLQNYKKIPGTETKLETAVAQVGPVSVAIKMSNADFKNYRYGIFDNASCNKSTQRHAVLIVGYDRDRSGKKFWIIKNSFGKRWGDNGYMMLLKEKNLCGIADNATYPLIK